MDTLALHPRTAHQVARTIFQMARAASAADVVEVLRSSARALIGSDGICVVRRGDSLCHYIEEDAIGPLWKGSAFPESACVTGWAMIDGKTISIPEIAADARIPHELYAGTFVRSMAAAPIRQSDPIGALAVYWSKPHQASAREIDVLEALASAAGEAFQSFGFIQPDRDMAVAAEGQDTDEAVEVALKADVLRVQGITAVPTILDVVLRMTGMGFAAVARVTDDRWIACQVLDKVRFGLEPGGELPIESTLCNEIRDHRQAIVFNDAAADTAYCNHHTPRIYGLRSYISVPIILSDGRFFGTLCAIDPNPATVNTPQVLDTFRLFAELIGQHLEASEQLDVSRQALQDEKEIAELREQFIAVLGHDLRNPLAAIDAGTTRLLKEGWTSRSPLVLALMRSSISRMAGLVDNLMDFARARMGAGIQLNVTDGPIDLVLRHIVDELKMSHPSRDVIMQCAVTQHVALDAQKIGQLFSNLLSNALSHGAEDHPVRVSVECSNSDFRLSVRNCGNPIPEDRLPDIFKPFHKSGHTRPAGLGLGLYIASQIAEAHGGTLTVASDHSETCFTLSLPLHVRG